MARIDTNCKIVIALDKANKLEREYADILEIGVRSGIVKWWGYEALRLRIGPNTFYVPDFIRIDNNGQVWCDEVKGFWRDDARVKIKVASSVHPWIRFRAVSKKKGEWVFEEFTP